MLERVIANIHMADFSGFFILKVLRFLEQPKELVWALKVMTKIHKKVQ
jgi:hypothetical protein